MQVAPKIDLFIEIFRKLNNISLFIYAIDDVIKKEYEKYGYNCLLVDTESDFYDEALKAGSNHSSFCCIKDIDLSSALRINTYGYSEKYAVWETMLGNNGYLNEINNLFMNEDFLGILFPAQMSFGINLSLMSNKYVETKIDSFWMKGCLAKKLVEAKFTYNLNTVLSQEAKENGYYVGIIHNSESITIRSRMLESDLIKIKNQLNKYWNETSDLESIKKLIFVRALNDFIAEHDNLYVYGTGVIAHRYADLLSEVKGYVVSDSQVIKGNFEGKRVWHLSEVPYSLGIGFVLCLDEKHQKEVIPFLKEKGYDYLPV